VIDGDDAQFPDVDAHVIDTNLFVAFERNDAIDLLERNVSEHEVTVSVPRRVYEELTPESLPYDTPPVDEAIEAGWPNSSTKLITRIPWFLRQWTWSDDTLPRPTSVLPTLSSKPMRKSVVRRRHSWSGDCELSCRLYERPPSVSSKHLQGFNNGVGVVGNRRVVRESRRDRTLGPAVNPVDRFE